MATIWKRTWSNAAGKATSVYCVDYKDQHGKRRRKQFKKRKDADAFLVKARYEVRQGVHTPDSQSITVGEAADIWLQACMTGRDGREPVEPHTWRVYRQHAELHIKPLIGHELLSRLSTPRVVHFRDDLMQSRSRAMAKRVLSSLKSILTEAQSRGLIAQNVATPVTVTSASRHKEPVAIPDKADIAAILNTARKWGGDPQPHIAKAWRRYHTLLLTACYTGMRASELRGLEWGHVDLKAGLIRVCQRADERCVIGPVKSGAGRREIPIGPELTKTLREWKLLCPAGDIVFPNWQGRVESYRNIHTRCWTKVCDRADLGRRFKFHHLRHFRASMLIASGATAKEVMYEMGHSSIQMTFDTYGHLFASDREARRSRAAEIELRLTRF